MNIKILSLTYNCHSPVYKCTNTIYKKHAILNIKVELTIYIFYVFKHIVFFFLYTYMFNMYIQYITIPSVVWLFNHYFFFFLPFYYSFTFYFTPFFVVVQYTNVCLVWCSFDIHSNMARVYVDREWKYLILKANE